MGELKPPRFWCYFLLGPDTWVVSYGFYGLSQWKNIGRASPVCSTHVRSGLAGAYLGTRPGGWVVAGWRLLLRYEIAGAI
jgi:hypothetical protein